MTVFVPKGDNFPLERYIELVNQSVFQPDWLEIQFYLCGYDPEWPGEKVFFVEFASGHKRHFSLETLQKHCTLMEE